MDVVPASAVRAQRQALADTIAAEQRQFMLSTLADQHAHAEVLSAGIYEFRLVVGRALGAMFPGQSGRCDEEASRLFRFFQDKWDTRYPEMSPKAFLDAYAPPSPETEDELESEYEIEIGSSDAYMRQHWEGSARTRKGRLKELGAKEGSPILQGRKLT